MWEYHAHINNDDNDDEKWAVRIKCSLGDLAIQEWTTRDKASALLTELWRRVAASSFNVVDMVNEINKSG